MIISCSENNGIILECQICFEEYDNSNKKPLVLECGHSICQKCLQQILSSNRQNLMRCPFDNKQLTRSIDQCPTNWSYIDIITNYRKINKQLHEYPNYREISLPEGKYKGQVEATSIIRNGYGKMEYIDGSIYLGNWKKNKRNDKGKFTHPDKREYDGEWEEDMPHGFGKYQFNCGVIKSYEGSWRAGKFFGMGKITYTNNSELETIFVDGVSCCDIVKIKTEDNRIILAQNEMIKVKGRVYEIGRSGEVFVGLYDPNNEQNESLFSQKRNGPGIIYFKDGGKYEGSFLNDKLNGLGVFNYKDGGNFEGEFKDNLRNGKGIFTYPSGDIYDGEWLNHKKNGFGVLSKKTGEIYKGTWEKDIKCGTGKFMMNNGYSYDGSWLEDKKEGKGVETFPNEESYYGDFKNGLKEGKGLFVFKNGDTYKGEWSNDKMHGIGTLVTRDGEEVSAKWSNGLIVKENNKDGKDKNCIIF